MQRVINDQNVGRNNNKAKREMVPIIKMNNGGKLLFNNLMVDWGAGMAPTQS